MQPPAATKSPAHRFAELSQIVQLARQAVEQGSYLRLRVDYRAKTTKS
jgi:hypothetical protein